MEGKHDGAGGVAPRLIKINTTQMTARNTDVEVVQKYWICYLVTGIFKQFHGTDIGCVR
jgi:hypothetical protein